MEFLITFWTVNCVIALIAWLIYCAVVKRKKTAKRKHTHTTKTTLNTPEVGGVLDFEDYLSHLVDCFLWFKDVYLKSGDRITLFLAPELVQLDFEQVYRLNLEVLVSDWWDNILVSDQAQKDVFLKLFQQTEELHFLCKEPVLIAKTYQKDANGVYDLWRKQYIDKFQKFLSEYEKTHADVRFERIKDIGASISFCV